MCSKLKNIKALKVTGIRPEAKWSILKQVEGALKSTGGLNPRLLKNTGMT